MPQQLETNDQTPAKSPSPAGGTPTPPPPRKRRRPRKKSSKLSQVLSWLFVLGGLLLLARPVITDWLYALEAEQAIDEIVSTYNDMNDPERLENLAQARGWNARLRGEDPGMDLWDYDWQLTYKSTPKSMMAWVDIPKINTRLPIYHGTGEAALSAGVGHCDWSALPVDAPGDRCVLTAHSGMQRTRMFDDIRLLESGDVFVLWALGEPYAYRVFETEVILPDEVDHLKRVEGRDLCTLVTCTPYGVNSHRLLVTGERCEYDPETMGDTTTLEQFLNMRTIPLLIGMALLLVTGVVLAVRRRRARKRWQKATSEALGRRERRAAIWSAASGLSEDAGDAPGGDAPTGDAPGDVPDDDAP